MINILDVEKPDGLVLQFGGQTPLKLSYPLAQSGVRILGTLPDAIDLAEDRGRFKVLLDQLNLRQPPSGTARSIEESASIAKKLTFPVLLRPSYVLGGRAMEIVYDEPSLKRLVRQALLQSPKHPVLIDRYLEDAIELDVDAICDGVDVMIAGIMEHIEESGIHSGDSACSLPPFSLSQGLLGEIRRQTVLLAKAIGVVGLMNVQFAVRPSGGSDSGRKADEIFVLEVNPRASRTVPFVSKVIGIPLAKVAMKVMLGRRLKELGFTQERMPTYVAVKEAVFPFNRFKGVDTLLGPEMKSTGEAMGIDAEFGLAFSKAQSGAGGGSSLLWNRFYQREGYRQAPHPECGRKAQGAGVSPNGYKGYGGVLPKIRHHGGYRSEGKGRPTSCAGPTEESGDRPGHQYRWGPKEQRRLLCPPAGDFNSQHSLLYHHIRCQSGAPSH